jgi:DNA modification methylase
MEPYYQDDSCTIYHADCRDVLPELPKVDLVLTDPPYGIGEASGKNSSRSSMAKAVDYGVGDWDDKPINWGLLWELLALGKHACFWGGNYYPVPPSPSWLVWDKCNGKNDFADCELAWSNYGCAVRIRRHLWHGMLRKDKESRYHPTQKPLELMKWCIGLCPGNPNTILDPLAGSFTTLRAAKDLGLKAVGVDSVEKYCEIGAKRLAQEVLPL